MIDELTYVNSLGQEVSFGGAPGRWGFGETDLLDMSMDFASTGGVITSFSSGISTRSLRVLVDGGDEGARRRLVDVLGVDARRCVPGTLRAGGCYLRCYASGLALSDWYYFDDMAAIDVTFTVERPAWVRKTSHTLAVLDKPEGGLDYPHDYAHDYTYSTGTTAVIANPSPLPSPCDIAFPGPCVNPFVIIAGNRYQVMASAGKGELIIVRGYGRRKDIVLRSAAGVEQSIFAAGVREEGAHVFAEVPAGESVASWDGVNNVGVTLYEERWTPWSA